jgi:hypothetical protein
MVPNFSQYSPQGLASQFPGLQGAGWPQLNPGLFGQPGPGGGNVSFGPDSGQPGLGQQYPFGAQTNSSAQNPFVQNPFVTQPYQQNPLLQGSFAHSPAQHLVTLLGQLALQLAAHGAVTQQIGIALHQVAQQLGAQSLQGYASGFGGGQYFGQNPFAGAVQAGYGQGGYSGFNPQGQAWGANRPQTIQ